MCEEEFMAALRRRTTDVLTETTRRLSDEGAPLVCKVGQHSNGSFPLRTYLSIRREGGERELAITIDVKATDRDWELCSDICYEDGTVLLAGPTAIMSSADTTARQRGSLEWTEQLRRFLTEKYDVVAVAARTL